MALAGLWGDFPFASGREDAQLRDHHDDAERLYAKLHILCRWSLPLRRSQRGWGRSRPTGAVSRPCSPATRRTE